MDKFEYKVRADEIKDLISQGDYAQAAEIADTIDWRRVKSVMMLCTISDLYKINRRYEDAKNILLLAYERRPGGRTICYSLCELCIKTEDFVPAVNYYKEFVNVAPKDPGRYILQYKLYEAQDVSLEERIGVLEELKKHDYREKWAYELAYLYHRIGLATRCVEECDELILWFGEGKYVIKAMELKMLHEPLTPIQQEKYDSRFGARQQVSEAAEAQPEAAEVQPEADAVVTDGVSDDTKIYTMPMDVEQPVAEEDEIHVKTMDVGQYNTINLQAALAEGLKEVLGDGNSRNDEITRSIMEPMMHSDETESLDMPEIDEVDAEDLGPESENIESEEVFFGETGEIRAVNPESDEASEAETPGEAVMPADEATNLGIDGLFADEAEVPNRENSLVAEQVAGEDVPSALEAEISADETAAEVLSQMREEEQTRQEALVAQPPEEMARVLSQESDGQIRLFIPESESIEKQITGQMSIEDILTEWERMKKDNEEKRKEEVRQHVLQQTGQMFTEFEASVRDGLLEKLEKGDIAEVTEETLAETAEEVAAATQEDDEIEAAPEDTAGVEDEPFEEVPGDDVTEDFETEELEEVEEPGEDEAEDELAEEVTETEDVFDETEEELDESEEIDTEIEDAPADTEELLEEAEEPAQETEEISEEVEDVVSEETKEEVAEETAEAVEEAAETVEETAEPAKEAEMEASGAEGAAQESVERDKAKVRSLTREEKELYAPYIQSRAAREGLVKAIDGISMAAYTGNVIITGDEGMDTMTLAKNMVREIQMTDSNFSGKVAKISGEGFNSKNPEEILEHLKSGALIVSKASGMNRETAVTLHKLLQQESLGIVIVLEDTKKAMNKFLASNADLAESFTARVDVEALSNDTLVAFGRQYAREMEYSIDELGVLALHTRIEELQTIDHAVNVVEVKKIVDEAIRHANRKTPKHFFDVLFAKRYDAEDMIILTEKDFA